MERIEQLKVTADQLERELFSAQCRRLETEYQNINCRNMVIEIFEKLFNLAAEQNKEVTWLGVCILNSSLETRSHEVLLTLFNQEFYFDLTPVEVFWRPPTFKECFEEDMDIVMRKLRNKFPRIWAYEEAQVRRVCVEYYHAALCRLCQDLWSEVMERKAFKAVKKTADFAVFFGPYRGEGEILWHTEEA